VENVRYSCLGNPVYHAPVVITDFSLIPRKANATLRPIGGRQQFSSSGFLQASLNSCAGLALLISVSPWLTGEHQDVCRIICVVSWRATGSVYVAKMSCGHQA